MLDKYFHEKSKLTTYFPAHWPINKGVSIIHLCKDRLTPFKGRARNRIGEVDVIVNFLEKKIILYEPDLLRRVNKYIASHKEFKFSFGKREDLPKTN